jgi:hypothetical protein
MQSNVFDLFWGWLTDDQFTHQKVYSLYFLRKPKPHFHLPVY